MAPPGMMQLPWCLAAQRAPSPVLLAVVVLGLASIVGTVDVCSSPTRWADPTRRRGLMLQPDQARPRARQGVLELRGGGGRAAETDLELMGNAMHARSNRRSCKRGLRDVAWLQDCGTWRKMPRGHLPDDCGTWRRGLRNLEEDAAGGRGGEEEDAKDSSPSGDLRAPGAGSRLCYEPACGSQDRDPSDSEALECHQPCSQSIAHPSGPCDDLHLYSDEDGQPALSSVGTDDSYLRATRQPRLGRAAGNCSVLEQVGRTTMQVSLPDGSYYTVHVPRVFRSSGLSRMIRPGASVESTRAADGEGGASWEHGEDRMAEHDSRLVTTARERRRSPAHLPLPHFQSGLSAVDSRGTRRSVEKMYRIKRKASPAAAPETLVLAHGHRASKRRCRSVETEPARAGGVSAVDHQGGVPLARPRDDGEAAPSALPLLWRPRVCLPRPREFFGPSGPPDWLS